MISKNRHKSQFFMTDEQMCMMFEHLSEGIQIIDAEGRLVFCNQKAAMLDDINILESVGKHITEIYPSLAYDESTLLEVLCTQTPIYNREQTYRTYRGKTITTVNTTLPLQQAEEIYGAVEISNDITAYKVLTDQYMALRQKVSSPKNHGDNEKQTLYCFEDIITHNAAFNRVKTIAMKASLTDMPILIYGETGTGKEMLAQAIHGSSKRTAEAFIAQNCAALPGSLLEGILFGTVKGGFTGAIDRPGLFELADGGTLFLDEINSMPLELQAKLLRVLQEAKIRRIGDTKERLVDVRILAATNIEPNKAIEQGMLRRDLYYRLNTIFFWIPRLADRREDLSTLTDHFIERYNTKHLKHYAGISPDVKAIFEQYAWNGNVRELEHVLESAMLIGNGQIIEVDDLPHDMLHEENRCLNMLLHEDQSMQEAVEALEAAMIESALSVTGRNTTQAAQKLKMPRQTLQYKMKKYGIV
ncbi:sigma 54-interacting transcriptional regulator [Fusibacter paucivorans]|uniref:Sigma 54-interacting transcriptional regulator n=1 Tax=Fusibacter paucivorans TaxID=76009 RepID=A0ABS5PR92_9FIRM|nr:sigma 54-interacting transcriptional regulator [Fusibacter paucivorans]MBS7526577.1 sigma 54-interacting transcriptional regulator [Fusibacter paucivorans]